jgi:hypothetical protein
MRRGKCHVGTLVVDIIIFAVITFLYDQLDSSSSSFDSFCLFSFCTLISENESG